MSTKTGILEEGGPRHKRKPCELSDEEVFQLMQAFTRDQCMITEDDALTLCHWAQGIRFSATVLELVMAGHLRVEVEGSEVKVGLPG